MASRGKREKALMYLALLRTQRIPFGLLCPSSSLTEEEEEGISTADFCCAPLSLSLFNGGAPRILLLFREAPFLYLGERK